MKQMPVSARKTGRSHVFETPHRLKFADAADVATKLNPDTPVHCFSPSLLKAKLAVFRDGFPGEVSYAVKANDGEHVLAALAANGLAVYDVASLEEMAAVRAASPHARLHYHNPIKSRNEIATAAERFGCVRFAADDAQEIDKIIAVGGTTAKLEIAVRFKLPKHTASAHDFSSKFGALPEQAIVLLRHVAACGAQPMLTFHPGSQCGDPTVWARHIHAAAEIARGAGVRLAALNVGGGFPSRYVGLNAPDLSVYFETIETAAIEAFGADFVPVLECEPGRGIIAGSTSVLARVKLVKAGTREVYLNDGIYGSLMEVYQVPVIQPFSKALRRSGTIEGPMVSSIVYGPTCDPLDRLPNRIELPQGLAEGDYIEFGPLGAYGTATSTRFNGYPPAEIIEVERVLIA
jgi:ornithine decarboxylase